jgi:hypothetical protein
VTQGYQRAGWRWNVVAVLLLLLAVAYNFRALWGEDISVMVPAVHKTWDTPEPPGYPGEGLQETDQQFVAWLVARNVRTFWTNPLGAFDAETCFPVVKSLALGEPALNLGVLGMPTYLFTQEPLAIYNLVLMVLPLVSGLILYWVVTSWTGLPAAGIVAGLSFGLHPLRMYDPVHFYIYDSIWTLLALFFAQRLFAHRRWRDTLGFCFATFMQLSGSIYPTMMAVLLGIPFLIWLIREYGLRQQRVGQLLFVLVFFGASLVFLFGPFLALAESDPMQVRRAQAFRTLAFLLPGNGGFPGWLALALLICAFALPARLGLPALGRDPRKAIGIGLLICYGLSFGAVAGDYATIRVWSQGEGLPPVPFMLLASHVPGLGVLRSPGVMYDCSMVVLALLIGIGMAALIRRVPDRFRVILTIGLVAIFFAEAARPSWLGPERTMKYTAFPMRPPQPVLDLYSELEAMGNTGPLLQVPAAPRQPRREAFATLLSAYHGRKTGQCYNSLHTPDVDHVREVSAGLPSRESVEALRRIGFTTLVVVYPYHDMKSPRRRLAFEAFAGEPVSPIQELARIENMTAYEIVDGGAEADSTR